MPDSAKLLSYIDRALADDYLFDQLHELVTDGRRATKRAQRRGVRDRHARRDAGNAIIALVRAAHEARQPKPKPRRRGRRAIVLAGAGAAAVYGANRGPVDARVGLSVYGVSSSRSCPALRTP